MLLPFAADAPGLLAAFSKRPAWREPFLTETLPMMGEAAEAARTALATSALEQGEAGEISLDRQVVLGLLSGLFLGTISLHDRDARFFQPVSYGTLLGATQPHMVAKLLCHLAYFRLATTKAPSGQLVISRRVLDPVPDAAFWAAHEARLMPFQVRNGVIEQAHGCLQVDFANRFLGGGALTGGCVQEEIRFSVSPELIVAMLFCPAMLDHEAIVLEGSQRFSETTGYGFGLRFGRALDVLSAPDNVVAIDAIAFGRPALGPQLDPSMLLREANKAYCGFASSGQDIATGNWGCGVFGGDPQLKALIQWAAASAAGSSLQYFDFGEARVTGLQSLVDTLLEARVTVGELWRSLVALSPDAGVFDQIAGQITH